MIASKSTLTIGAGATTPIARLIRGRTLHGRPFTPPTQVRDENGNVVRTIE